MSDKTCQVSPTGGTTFPNINQNLPPGIFVDQDNSFCLGDSDGSLERGSICYKNTPGVHRVLSRYNLNDYKRPEPKSDRKEDHDTLSLEAMDDLLPGMWLNCLYDQNDATYYEAMFLTANAEQMRPDVVANQQYPHEGLIGVEYDSYDWDEEEEVQKWIPISWCRPNHGYSIWTCNASDDATDSQCDYMIGDSSIEPLFRRAFKDLADIEKQQQSESSNLEKKVLFTYTQEYGQTVVEDEYGYFEMKSDTSILLPVEMDTSSYTSVYSALPFSHPAVQEVDNKFKLFLLYKDDPVASNVFPKSYSSYREALLGTKPGHDENMRFYIKGSGAARGEDIHIKSWDELALDYKKLQREGDYDVDNGEGDVIIQQAVTDLYIIDGDGIIANRRFDIRFFVLITNGKVYLHSYMFFRWSLGPEYNPLNTDVQTQVINVVAYAGGEMARMFFLDTPHEDVNGNTWSNRGRKRRSAIDYHSPGSDKHRGVDAHGWRDAVADALDDASGIFSSLKEITKADNTKYVLAGGDAMIKEDGSAVIVEFNIWPDLAVSYSSLTKCLAGEGCRRMVMMMDNHSDIDADNYVVTEPSAAASIASAGGLAEVMRDTASMVMKIQPANDIKGFREIIAEEKKRTD